MADDRRFDGWKTISNYLGRDRSTVMRWTRERGLPVHRVPGGQTGTVFALRDELGAWLAQGGNAALVPIYQRGTPPTPLTPSARAWPSWSLAVLATLGVIAVLAIVAVLLMRVSGGAGRPIGIAAVTSSDADPASKRFAGELTSDLARFANASAGLAIYDGSGLSPSDAPYRVRTSVERGPMGLAARVWMISAEDGSVIWSRRIEQSTPEISVLRERVAANVVGVARCAFGAIANDRRKVSTSEMALLLSTCQRLFDAEYVAAIAPIRELTRIRPDLAFGWAALSLVQSGMEGESSGRSLVSEARSNAERALRIAPEQSLSQLAMIVARGDVDPIAFATMEQALRVNPDEPRLLRQWSLMLFDAGYVDSSVEPALRAMASDPTWMSGRDFAVRRLAAAGRFEEAFKLQGENERLWPGHPQIAEQRARLVRDATMSRTTTDAFGPDPEVVAQTAVAEPYRAYELARAMYRGGQRAPALAMLARAPVGRSALQQRSLLFWPSAVGLRTEPIFFQKMAEHGLIKIWAARRRWPDFCSQQGLRYDCRTEAAKLGVAFG